MVAEIGPPQQPGTSGASRSPDLASLPGEENLQKSYAEKLFLALGLEVSDQGNKGHHVVDGQEKDKRYEVGIVFLTESEEEVRQLEGLTQEFYPTLG